MQFAAFSKEVFAFFAFLASCHCIMFIKVQADQKGCVHYQFENKCDIDQMNNFPNDVNILMHAGIFKMFSAALPVYGSTIVIITNHLSLGVITLDGGQ